MISPERQYLLDYLAEEFSRHDGVRVRPAPSKRYYGPEGPGELIESPGIYVRTEAREYFFPYEWADPRRRAEVSALVNRIKDALED